MAIEAKIEKGKLIITADVDEQGQPSGSGKTTVHVSTHGNITLPVQVNGKPLVLGLNAYTKR